jgi:hypothetical protein
MDILNFISWIRGKRKVTSVDPDNLIFSGAPISIEIRVYN